MCYGIDYIYIYISQLLYNLYVFTIHGTSGDHVWMAFAGSDNWIGNTTLHFVIHELDIRSIAFSTVTYTKIPGLIATTSRVQSLRGPHINWHKYIGQSSHGTRYPKGVTFAKRLYRYQDHHNSSFDAPYHTLLCQSHWYPTYLSKSLTRIELGGKGQF